MSSIAFFTRVKASRRTRLASVERRGLWSRWAAAASNLEAFVRRSEWVVLCSWTKAGLKVRVKRSWASSPLRTARALETASISSWRVFWRSSHSLSVIWHFSFNIMRNCSSAEREARVSSISCLDWLFFMSVSASSAVFVSICAVPAAISSSFAALRSSYAFWFAISSFCDSERFDSKVSFICRRMPKISPDWGLKACLKVGVAS
mmetsp:Transcript_24564/g.52121  ORF Transcript_24564/g.52121 Transcript_24564/m.52121 type:complete len:205 (-) Transcript_24564:720-1334(-)